MKVELTRILSIKGYSKLYGIHHTRIKAVGRHINTSSSNRAVDVIRRRDGSHTCEYRLLKEPKGFIFRETLLDNGISGHHKTMKSAITSALKFVTIHIDENFNYSEFTEYKRLEKQHEVRNQGYCKHSLVDRYKCCNVCGLRSES